MELYQSIRHAVSKEGCSIRATAKEFKVHRREVRRALASAIPPERKSTIKMRPKLGPYESTIRAWLTEDLKVPKKQRHTATRIWQRLVDECGADVSVSSVRVMLVVLGATACFVLGAARLLLTDSISLLGLPASCGNPLAYLMGSDNAHALGLLVCRGPLRNAAIEGIALIVLAVILFIFAFVIFMSTMLKRRPNSADSGEISWWLVSNREGWSWPALPL